MNSSNISSNISSNNVTKTIFSTENTKPNNKKDSKSHNYKAVKKTEERCEKVESLINKLPNKIQKQLQTLKTGPGTVVSTVQKKALNEKVKVGPKTNFACEVRDAIADDAAAIDDAWTEHEENEEQKCEQIDEELEAWLIGERQKVWQAAYEKWIENKAFDEYHEWYSLKDELKVQYYQLDDSIARCELEPETKFETLDEYERNKYERSKYEMDELQRSVSNKSEDINGAINGAKFQAKISWLEDQLNEAKATDDVVTIEDAKFVAYMVWLNANEMYSDTRYVTWALQQYCDEVALDDSKYDELPLHERYTWDSDSEEDDGDIASV